MKKLDKLKIEGEETFNHDSKEFLLVLLVALVGFSFFILIFNILFRDITVCYCLSGISCIICLRFILKKEKFNNILNKFKNKKTWILGISLGVILTLINLGLSSIVESIVNDIGANETNVRDMINDNKFYGIGYVVIFAPIIEEFGYRYGIFGFFKKNKRWIAYLFSGLFFGLLHLTSAIGADTTILTEVLSLGIYTICGLLLCFVYDYTNSLSASILAHMINNLIAVVLLFI